MTSPEPPPRLSAPPSAERRPMSLADVEALYARANPAPDFPIYRKGARVTHLDHGRGTVVETNTSTTVYVALDEWGGGTCGFHWHDVTKIGVRQPDDTAQ